MTGGNFPRLEAELRPEPGFERFRELFDAQLAATRPRTGTPPIRSTTASATRSR